MHLAKAYEEVIELIGKHDNLYQEMVEELCKEDKDLRRKCELLTKAQQQQAVTNLQALVFILVGGKREKAARLIDLEKIANPGKSEDWYLKKVILNLQFKLRHYEAQIVLRCVHDA